MSDRASPAPLDVAVIGAGLVGSSCALALALDGHRVTLFDPDPPGAGTSSGNAGGIVTGAVVPTATPQVLRALPGYVLDRNSPAVLRLRHAIPALPWLWRFVRAGRPAEVARIAAALWPLVDASLAAHRRLAGPAAAAGMITDEGWLKVYASGAEFAATAADRRLMDRCGVRYQVLDRDAVLALEPGLNPDLAQIGLHQPESGFVRDPRGLAQRYADAACARGARHLRQRVRGVTRRPDGVTVHADGGPRDHDRVVIAAGAWSAALARQLGDRVSLDTERGYHLGFGPETAGLLRRPVGLPGLGMVLSPMQGGLRLVSGDELAGLAAPPDFRRIRALLPGAVRAVPGLRGQPVTSEWMGFRPSTPDSLPVIGPSPRGPQVVHAFGHGHLGLTLSAITALMVADAVAGRPPRIDLHPYSIGRFR